MSAWTWQAASRWLISAISLYSCFRSTDLGWGFAAARLDSRLARESKCSSSGGEDSSIVLVSVMTEDVPWPEILRELGTR